MLSELDIRRQKSPSFWDWTMDSSGTQDWSDRAFDMMGLDRSAGLSATGIMFVMNQPFWLSLQERVERASFDGRMVNVSGRFTSAQGDSVTVWALGQRIGVSKNDLPLMRVRFCSTKASGAIAA